MIHSRLSRLVYSGERRFEIRELRFEKDGESEWKTVNSRRRRLEI